MSNRAHQGNTYRKNRRAIEAKKAIRWDDRKMADLSGHAPTTCQFMAGEDHYMCGAPGFPYCPTHYALTHRKETLQDAAE